MGDGRMRFRLMDPVDLVRDRDVLYSVNKDGSLRGPVLSGVEVTSARGGGTKALMEGYDFDWYAEPGEGLVGVLSREGKANHGVYWDWAEAGDAVYFVGRPGLDAEGFVVPEVPDARARPMREREWD